MNHDTPDIGQRPKSGTDTRPSPDQKLKRRKTDKKAAYLLIAPAMILIFLIAVWPVVQSFYFSLFDLRLNDPAKSSVHFSYNLDLERYLNNYPFLLGTLDQEIRSGHGKEQLSKIKQQLQKLDQTIQSDARVKQRYDAVNDKLINFEPVSSDLKFVKVDKPEFRK